ncbi:MAG: hypothetical protein QNJ67_02230 [Kiloniellales bacterium]|nr:hypothetical protein [Kiloniellales bacterium]
MEHRMQWLQSELIDQIVDGSKTASVRRIEWSEGIDAFNTPLHVGAVYRVYDRDRRPRCRLRLTGIELVRWGAIPERLWREDPAASGEVSLAAFRADHDDFFDRPDDNFEFLALYFHLVAPRADPG